MTEFPQTTANLTAMTTNLYEAVKGGNLIAYPEEDIRLAFQRAVIIEGSRGMRIGKEKSNHRIDVVVALAMAALGAVDMKATRRPFSRPFFAGIGVPAAGSGKLQPDDIEELIDKAFTLPAAFSTGGGPL